MTESTECTRLRKLLGVYVLGAIEPAERAMVDAHLNACPTCRDELASLAGLPALLSRVTEEQIEQLAPPPRDLFDSIVAHATREDRVRRRRNGLLMTVAAAALVVVTGVSVGAIGRTDDGPSVGTSKSPAPIAAGKTVSGSDATTGMRAQVTLVPKKWGTAVVVHLSGGPAGAHCRLYVVDKSGWRDIAGGWEVQYAGSAVFNGSSMIPSDQVASVEFRTTDGTELLKMRA
jgi:anti-sigma factor RsiW